MNNLENQLVRYTLPSLAEVRGYHSNESMALIKGLAEYGIDARVSMNRTAEENETQRVGIIQGGLTRRAEIGAGVMYDAQSKALEGLKCQVSGQVSMNRTSEEHQTKRTKIVADVRKYEVKTAQENETIRVGIRESGLTQRTYAEQDGMTRRAEIKTQGLVELCKQTYAARVKMRDLYVKGQMHISDNQLKAACAEAQAYKDTMITTEQIRADAIRGISKDKLEVRIKEATLRFYEKMNEANNLLKKEQHQNRTRIAELYILCVTQLLSENLQRIAEFERIQGELEKEKLRSQTECYQAKQRTIQIGVETIESLANGKKKAKLIINEGGEETQIIYISKD